jgi:DNA (cytosine-5)-methyltransferase 1
VCSGIEAISTAWEPLGCFEPAWFSEIESFLCSVLAAHWPEVPNLGDMNKLAARVLLGDVEAPDILVGGTPCQSYSLAGLRKSLGDERGQLTLNFIRLADAIDTVRLAAGKPPCIILWENVPGILSTKDNAFGCFLAGLAGEDLPLVPAGKRWTSAGCVFGNQRAITWRVLDAQYFGVPQRRRRVFVVASAGAVRPEQILFESQSLPGDSEASKEARKGNAPAARTSLRDSSWPPDVSYAVTSKWHKGTGEASGAEYHNLVGDQPRAVHQNASGELRCYDTVATIGTNQNASGRNTPLIALAFPANLSGTQCATTEDLCPALGAKNPTAIAFVERRRAQGRTVETSNDLAFCVTSPGESGRTDNRQILDTLMRVRRIMPVEAERLQGFPRGHTLVVHKGKQAKDSPRYKAIGNSMAVPVVSWIGKRIIKAITGETLS